MKKILAVLFLCCPLVAFAQSTPDSCIQYHKIKGNLSGQSMVSKDGKYYSYFAVNMTIRDRMIVRYSSGDYVVAMAVQDSAGRAFPKAGDGAGFKKNGSTVVMPFQPRGNGPHTVVFSTEKAGKTGDYTADVFYFHGNRQPVQNDSPFCAKLQFLLENTHLNFEFLKGYRLPASYGDRFATTLQLFPGTACDITQLTGTAYQCVFPEIPDSMAAVQFADKIAAQLTGCLAGFEKTEHIAPRRNVLREIIFTLRGKNEIELNMTNTLANIRNRVTLRLSKGPGYMPQYLAEVMID